MAGRVIQGFFIGGAMRPQPAQRVAAGEARPRSATGAPPPAFAGRAAPLQARMAPGRPPLAHQGAGHVAQPHGGNGSFEIDAVQVGLARGGGKPLPEGVLAKMEAAFGADFSAVRVHVGPQAARIGAVAFTTGNDLYFAPGRYQPESVQGQQLIGHELAHVIQQRQGRVRAPGSGIAVVQDRMLEAEADRLGMRAAAHRAPLQAKMAASGRSEAQVHISAPGGTSPGSYRLTAGSGPNPIGSLVVHTRRGAAAEVTDLGVAPGHRDQGIGRQLLVSAARAGLRSGNSKLSLSAQDNGTGKLTRWYKDMGFRQVGVNGRGMPVLEAPISRLLAGSVQPKLEAEADRLGVRAASHGPAGQREAIPRAGAAERPIPANACRPGPPGLVQRKSSLPSWADRSARPERPNAHLKRWAAGTPVQRSSTMREMLPSEVDSQSTHATGWLNDSSERMTLYGTTHSGGLHAEDMIKKIIESKDIKGKTLVLYLTKSPCTCTERTDEEGKLPATGKGCAEMLAKLADERDLKFQLLIRNYYSPSIRLADRASVAAVRWLQSLSRFAVTVEKEARSNAGKRMAEKLYEEEMDDDGFMIGVAG